MAEFFSRNDEDKEYQEMSQGAKDIVLEQGNLEAHEILMITGTIHCKSCYNYATPGRTYCKTG